MGLDSICEAPDRWTRPRPGRSGGALPSGPLLRQLQQFIEYNRARSLPLIETLTTAVFGRSVGERLRKIG